MYCFTVFQHIPRDCTRALLADCASRLASDGTMVFNLLIGINEDLDHGETHTEWTIGYNPVQPQALLNSCGLRAKGIKRWRADNIPAALLWIQA